MTVYDTTVGYWQFLYFARCEDNLDEPALSTSLHRLPAIDCMRVIVISVGFSQQPGQQPADLSAALRSISLHKLFSPLSSTTDLLASFANRKRRHHRPNYQRLPHYELHKERGHVVFSAKFYFFTLTSTLYDEARTLDPLGKLSVRDAPSIVWVR